MWIRNASEKHCEFRRKYGSKIMMFSGIALLIFSFIDDGNGALVAVGASNLAIGAAMAKKGKTEGCN